MKKIVAIISFLAGLCTYAQNIQYSQIFDKNIQTLEVKIDGVNLSDPILILNGDDILKISFDELSFNAKNYSYKINHCNADWTISNVTEFEYMDGLNWNDIDDYQQSVNTMINYTHYTFFLPNDYVQFKISGNYIVTVFESSNPDKPCFIARFCVTEQLADIDATVRANTDIGVRTKYQQVDFDVYTQSLQVTDPFSEVKVVVQQNNRIDNSVRNIKPTFIASNKLSYTNNKALIFEAGNEYRSLELSNIRILDDNVSEIKFIDPMYHVSMYGDEFRNQKSYVFTRDANGKYVINLQRNIYDNEIEADYMYVHFSLPVDQPFLDGSVYLTGAFNFSLLNAQSQMKYVSNLQSYILSVLLKQGGYNYQYLFLPKDSTKATTEPIEGNYWETENEYQIFVYYKPPGSRYDRLIGYEAISSNR